MKKARLVIKLNGDIYYTAFTDSIGEIFNKAVFIIEEFAE